MYISHTALSSYSNVELTAALKSPSTITFVLYVSSIKEDIFPMYSTNKS